MRAPLLFALALLLSACASVGPGGIAGMEWRAVDVNGVPATGEAPTLRLGDGQASGSGGCNSFTASYRFESRERIDFGPINATRIACPEPAMEQERRYFSILDAAESYSRYGDGSLSIIAPDGRAVRFRRVR
jgi:putative lipoprotein